ncbi:MAG: superoxide dismutase [Cu-Zn] SodC [Undibacterium sp.]|uniref:superoxide dismutase [Cu-Zn] SodC n=1 Tax=Undibacterium sp. TaxID=1914977 RepID=UPI00271804FE|nr:superoxide dismutase [Cu-Zn] SodC [Undibacterium sp.]MDO8654785.1 superoxide dismutase [Cu-Zn] SodC [Undibacterium sp.]
MKYALSLALYVLASAAHAESVSINLIDEKGSVRAAGVVQYQDTPYGLLFSPQLSGIPPGLHGFHIHEKPSCAAAEVDGKVVAGAAAGGHWDPEKTGKHLGPYTDKGHQGDLPALFVNADGAAVYPVLAPRLKAADVHGHALMIHAGGDNHDDHPAKLGGGGARLLCGVF